MKHVGP